MNRNLTAVSISLAFGGLVIACGGGRPSFATNGGAGSGALKVHLSAGTPIAGATVTVYAVNDSDGRVNTLVGNSGVIGVGGPTDSSGDATIQLSMPNYSGPIQVTASGSNLSYVDPSTAALASSSATSAVPIQIPASFIFSSYYANYSPGIPPALTVNLLTTLADHEIVAFSKGLHRLHPGTKTLSASLADRDPLFVSHIASSSSAWNPTSLRTTIPAALCAGPQTLNDAAFAALFDLSLSALARTTSAAAGYPASSTSVNAITLTQLLEQDVDADGIFDGRGPGGVQLVVEGTTPLQLNSQYLRVPLAKALDTWIQSKSGNASGITQGDLVNGGVYVAISQDRSDLFGDAPDGLFNPADRVPPEVAFVGEPAGYMKSPPLSPPSLALAVTARDPSGVGGVLCSSSAANTQSPGMQQPDGHWECKVSVDATGPTQVSVWGVDSATPPNSGQGLAEPYVLTRTIIIDNAPPSIFYVATPSYLDERGLTLAMNGNVAAVPATYNYASSTKVGVATNGAFYKIATRLGWATQPSATDLEGGNAGNIPFLQYSVPYQVQTGAPIAVATYTVSIAGFPDATGNLWPSAHAAPDALFYDLPLSSNLIPAFASLVGPATLSVSVSFTDAAGNIGTRTGDSFVFHVLGPPVSAVEDPSYASVGDGKSTYLYALSAGNYAALYDPAVGTFLPDGQVRLTHYIISNPAPYPVAVGVSFAGSPDPASQPLWWSTESWKGTSAALGNTVTYQLVSDSFGTCGLPVSQCASNTYSGSPPGQCYAAPGGGPWQCGVLKIAGDGGHVASSGFATVAYYQLTGADPDRALHSSGGRYVVPAASGGTPGLLSLFVTRPHAVTRTIPIAGAPPYRRDMGHQYTLLDYRICICSANCFVARAQLPTGYYGDAWLYQEMRTAAESLAGQVRLDTAGLNGAAEFGEATAAPQTFTLNRTINH